MPDAFKDFGFRPEVQAGLDEAGYDTPTPIQSKSIPILLGGQDLIGVAETGTGKTLAFLLPIFQRLQSGLHDPQALVICPTRELAMQVAGDPDYWSGGHLSRALAICDWNNDGRVDFVVTDLKQPLALLENRTQTPHHWLQLELVGKSAERDAIGALVQVTTGERTLHQVVQSGDGYMCKNQPLLAFGLADRETVDQVTIRWPDGQQQQFVNLSADNRWLVVQGEPKPFARRKRLPE